MTGFGRGVTATNNYQLTVEVRSVNHRFLEIQTKFPKDWLEAEVKAKKILSQYALRGKLDVNVNFKFNGNEEMTNQINWPFIEALKATKDQLKEALPIENMWTMQDLFAVEGAFSFEKQSLPSSELIEAVEKAIKEAAEKMTEMRIQEGQQLKEAILCYNKQLKEFIHRIRDLSVETINKYRSKLIERILEVAQNDFVEDRVLTEVAIFAEKLDISEELDRLESHFKQVEGTLEQSGSIGRKLDFLMQEMHREINTIGSKNQNAEISMMVVEAKTILEKMREQVQNIE